MVGIPSTMSSCPQHTPLPAVLPTVLGMTAGLAAEGSPPDTGVRIAENTGVMPLLLVEATTSGRRQAA
jgi:hypothetical protein